MYHTTIILHFEEDEHLYKLHEVWSIILASNNSIGHSKREFDEKLLV
jgi:hypothetical protein